MRPAALPLVALPLFAAAMLVPGQLSAQNIQLPAPVQTLLDANLNPPPAAVQNRSADRAAEPPDRAPVETENDIVFSTDSAVANEPNASNESNNSNGTRDADEANVAENRAAADAGGGIDWLQLGLAFLAGLIGGYATRVLPPYRRHRRDGPESRDNGATPPAPPPAPGPPVPYGHSKTGVWVDPNPGPTFEEQQRGNRRLDELLGAPPPPAVVPPPPPPPPMAPPPPPPPEQPVIRQQRPQPELHPALQKYIELVSTKGARSAEFEALINAFDEPLALMPSAGGIVAVPFRPGDANQFAVALGDGRSFSVVPTYEYVSGFDLLFNEAVQNPSIIRTLFEVDKDGSGDLRVARPASVSLIDGRPRLDQPGRLVGFRS